MRFMPRIVLPFVLVASFAAGCGQPQKKELESAVTVPTDEQESKTPAGPNEIRFPKMINPDDK
jgi:hypothetical protein